MIVALFAEEFEHLTIVTTFVITPLVFLGGVFHSIEMVPEVLRGLTVFNPMFYMVNGMRHGMLGTADVPLMQCMLTAAGSAVLLFAAVVYLFSIGFKLRK
jgi:ABC-2 type transport system permease protein